MASVGRSMRSATLALLLLLVTQSAPASSDAVLSHHHGHRHAIHTRHPSDHKPLHYSPHAEQQEEVDVFNGDYDAGYAAPPSESYQQDVDLNDLPWPPETLEKCFQLDHRRISCLFENIIYDKRARKFRYFGNRYQMEGPSRQTKMHLGLSSSARQTLFHIIYMGAFPLPPREETCDEPELTYLHALYNSHSFGHIVRDNFQTIVWNTMNLGIQTEPLNLLVLERRKKASAVPRVVAKYYKWIAKSVDLWDNKVNSCDRRYILFRRFVTGYGGVIYTRPPLGCFPANFLVQRNTAYRMRNLTLVPAYQIPRIRVLFGDKSPADSRRVTNLQELLPYMRARFPNIDFRVRMLANLTEYDQLRILRRTSIFLSPVGSSSFRLIYLPTGAHIILVGAPEFDEEGRPLKPVFSEVNECWTRLRYLTFSTYRVTQANESITRFERLWHGWQPESPEQVEQFRVWDADTVLDPWKLGNLIEDAIGKLRSERERQITTWRNEYQRRRRL